MLGCFCACLYQRLLRGLAAEEVGDPITVGFAGVFIANPLPCASFSIPACPLSLALQCRQWAFYLLRNRDPSLSPLPPSLLLKGLCGNRDWLSYVAWWVCHKFAASLPVDGNPGSHRHPLPPCRRPCTKSQQEMDHPPLCLAPGVGSSVGLPVGFSGTAHTFILTVPGHQTRSPALLPLKKLRKEHDKRLAFFCFGGRWQTRGSTEGHSRPRHHCRPSMMG